MTSAFCEEMNRTLFGAFVFFPFVLILVMLNYECRNIQIQKRIEERIASGLDTASLDDEAFNFETSLDRCILRLIASCCNGKLSVTRLDTHRFIMLFFFPSSPYFEMQVK